MPINDKTTNRPQEIQKEVEETLSSLAGTYTKIGERGERLNNLQGKTILLQDYAYSFQNDACRTRNLMRRRKMRMWGGIIAGIVVLIIIILVPTVRLLVKIICYNHRTFAYIV
ncbi:hypothetical protein BU23DRAFT_567881 [Bimuria novae-zelandiae CBS 107.79]|uniref:V-SNARE coiled-coil homology domain-containing protein n=1 Tax=Bimuria novae-zelandiae CBS 107.79 TaxID=1447943 RepID=A0A6A5V9M6_9PLEO|nr:hypothetical protein BU23DRAFT_567881 [Bimuria novae-zelandiae CBS 107.79]